LIPPLEFDPQLVEEAVFAATRDRPEAASYHQEREASYEERDPEARDLSFRRLHARWFAKLGLTETLESVVSEHLPALASVRRVLVTRAAAERQEGAELFVADAGERTLIVRIRPATLADRDAALGLLRREMVYVVDMLDPSFEYEPRLPIDPAVPGDRMLGDRYRLLWGVSVDGRLVRAGKLPEVALERRRDQFQAAFAYLGGRADVCFDRIAYGPRPDHPRLVALSRDPEDAFSRASHPTAR